MFLTKKSFSKILVMAVCYVLLGSICLGLYVVFDRLETPAGALKILGIIVYLLCIPMVLTGLYAEGIGKWVELGNKLVRTELRPELFLQKYEELKNADDLVVKKPSLPILQLVVTAYDSLNHRENALAAADEMIGAARSKKKAYASLIKASLLFSYEKTQEAEEIFSQIQKTKTDIMSRSLIEAIYKSDRAKAIGDYKTVESHCLSLLDRSFPKLDNLGKLITHYILGEVYEALEEKEKAAFYYRYCANHGGETAIRTDAKEKLLWE